MSEVWTDIPDAERATMQALLDALWPNAAQRQGLRLGDYSVAVLNLGGVWWSFNGLPTGANRPAVERAIADMAREFSAAGYYVERDSGEWRFLPATHPAASAKSGGNHEGIETGSTSTIHAR